MNNNIIGPINIGNPHEITIKELADILLLMIDTKSKVKYLDLPLNDPKVRQPDISKAIYFLNWRPSINLNLGLENTIKYFKKNMI